MFSESVSFAIEVPLDVVVSAGSGCAGGDGGGGSIE